MLRRVPVAFATLFLLVSALMFAPATHATIDAVEGCVTIYENGNFQGDRWQKCAFTTSLYNANLTGDIIGLGGTPLCNTVKWPVAGNDWNDCVSAISEGIPAGYVARFYRNANYSTPIACLYHGAGSMSLSGTSADDEISSWRVVSGVCGS